MSKISLNKLNLEKNTKTSNFSFEGQEIKVLNYLPVKDKMALIKIAIQESIEETMVNSLLLDAHFHTYLVIYYTNISLTQTMKENIPETYDLLEKNGFISMVIEAIPANEYSDLVNSLTSHVEKTEKRLNSVARLLKSTLDEMTEVLNSVDLEKENIKNLLSIAKDNGLK